MAKKTDEEQSMEIDSELKTVSLEDEARETLPPYYLDILKKISYYTSKVGLPLNESLLLLGIDQERFNEDMKKYPIIGKVVAIKKLEFKKELQYTLAQKARKGNDKIALWFLENYYPDEFGKSKNKDDSAKDMFEAALQHILENGDNSPMVDKKSNKPYDYESLNKTNDSMKKMAKDVLD